MIGKTISHYNILEKLGGGGMGVVYKAEDIKLKRIVALKFLPPAFSFDKEAKKRFINEAQTASSLQHYNICNIHDIDETKDGQIFICMDLYEGEILKAKIERGKLKTDEVVNIITQVATGLQKAHEKGIIHRDIKPANIFITNDGIVKILDFGLAKLSGQTMMTKMGETVGTIAYMSPEQARGEEVDQRTDIWSLGVVLFEMLTGELPFQSEYEQAMIYSILNESPKKLKDFKSDIPDEIEKVVTKCLSKNPSNRYQNIEELMADIKGSTDNLHNDKPKVTKKYFSQKLKATLLILVIIGAVYVVSKLFLSKDGINKENSEKISTSSLAVLPFMDLSSEKNQEYLCEGITEQIISNLSKLQRLKVIARTSVMKFNNSDKTVTEIGKELGIQNIIEGSLRKSENQIRVTAKLISVDDGFCIWSEEYDKELKNIFDIQDDISSSVVQAILRNVSPEESIEIKGYMPENQEAYDYYLKGKYQHNLYHRGNYEEGFNTSESLLKKSIELDSNYALSYAELANLYNTYTVNHYPTAPNYKHFLGLQTKYINKALRINPESSEVYVIKTGIDYQFNRKEEYFEDIIQAYKLNPKSVEAIFMLGRLYHNINLYDKAIEQFNIAIEHDPYSSFYFAKRGWAYFRLGNYLEAEKDLLHAFELDTLSQIAEGEYSRFLLSVKRFNEWERLRKPFKFKSDLAIDFAIKGDKKAALKNLKGIYTALYVYPLLNMQDEALTLLEKKIDECFTWDYGCYYKVLLNDPLFDGLRENKRFHKILADQKKLYEYYIGKYGDIDNEVKNIN